MVFGGFQVSDRTVPIPPAHGKKKEWLAEPQPAGLSAWSGPPPLRCERRLAEPTGIEPATFSLPCCVVLFRRIAHFWQNFPLSAHSAPLRDSGARGNLVAASPAANEWFSLVVFRKLPPSSSVGSHQNYQGLYSFPDCRFRMIRSRASEDSTGCDEGWSSIRSASALCGCRAQEPDLFAIDAAPFAEQEVKTQSEPLHRRERAIKRNRLQSTACLQVGESAPAPRRRVFKMLRGRFMLRWSRSRWTWPGRAE